MPINTSTTSTIYQVPVSSDGVQMGDVTTDKIGFYGASPVAQRASADQGAVTALAGTLTGTIDGIIEDISDIALSTSNIYSDAAVNSAVNTAIASVNLQLKEIKTVLDAEVTLLNEIRTSLVTLGLIKGEL